MRILSEGGCIVSQFALHETVGKGNFPARNRLIAGLSEGVLVTEGAADSGSLITASYGKAFGRPVFAVPGPITSSLSKGTNNLLKEGAIAVSSATDVLDSLGIITKESGVFQKRSVRGDTPDEQAVLALLQTGSLHFDEIVRSLKKDSKDVGSLLSLMELKGLLSCSQEGTYLLKQ